MEKNAIKMIQNGDTGGMEALAREYGKRLYSFIYNIVNNHESTDEILQETLVRAISGTENFESEDGGAAWLFKVAYHRSLDMLRGEKRKTENENRLREQWMCAARSVGDVEAEAARRERAALIRGALKTLPEKQRTALGLFAMQDVPIRQIAEIMECSQGAVMSHLHRARLAMREKLAPLTDWEEV